MRFCKDLLGVQKQTTNVGVLLEIGEIPLTIIAKNHSVRNYARIVLTKQANSILLSMFQTHYGVNSWFILNENSLNLTGIRKEATEIHRHLLPRLRDIFHQESMISINATESKLRTYSEIKTTPGLEPYLLLPMKIRQRIIFSKFRLSNHVLMIEKGRHLKIEKNQRFCPFCLNCVETERHFLLNCRIYAHIRKELFDKLEPLVPLILVNDMEKFSILMTNEMCLTQSANFVSRAFDIREFLTNKHKNNQ